MIRLTARKGGWQHILRYARRQWVSRNMRSVSGHAFRRIGGMGHSREALRVRRELDRELAEAAESVRRELVWSTAERVNLDSIMFTIDRVVVLRRAFAGARDTRQRTKLSAELRLLE